MKYSCYAFTGKILKTLFKKFYLTFNIKLNVKPFGAVPLGGGVKSLGAKPFWGAKPSQTE